MPTVCALSLITKATIVSRQRVCFLGYLRRRQSNMAEETRHMQVMPKMLKFTHARDCNSFSVSSGCKVPSEEMRRSSVLHYDRLNFFIKLSCLDQLNC